MIEIANQFGEIWARYFGLAVAQNTVFLGAVFLGLYVLRNASARTRYIVAMIGLLKLLLPPLVPVRLAAPTIDSLSPLTVMLSPAARSPISATSEALGTPSSLDVAGLLVILWLALGIVYLVSVLVSTHRLRMALRGAAPIEGPTGMRVPIYKSDRISVPLTIGILPKRVFVPTAWDQWGEECRQMVIRHETAHIVQRDGVVKLLQVFCQAIYWFHPLVWLLNRRLEEYREMACDDASTGPHRSFRLRYSKYLVEIAETVAPNPVTCESASALIRRKNELLSRVEYQIKEVTMSPVSKKRTAIMLAAISMLILPLSAHYTTATSDMATRQAAGENSQSGVTAKTDSKQFIGVFIESADDIRINGDKTALPDVQRRIESIITTNKDNVIIDMACGGDVTMGTLFVVQKVMIDMGLLKVNYQNAAGKGMPLVLPPETLKARMETVPDEYIAIVRLTADSNVLLEEKTVAMSKLKDSVEQRLAQNDKLIVSIHMDEKTPFKDFLEVLDQVKMAGAPRIFVNDPAM